jgi:hypothetical protein
LAKSPLDSISIEDLDNFLNKIKIKDVDVVADRSQPLFPVSGVNVPTERMPSSDGGFDTASDFYRAGEALRNEMREQPWSFDTALGKYLVKYYLIMVALLVVLLTLLALFYNQRLRS